MDSMDDFLETQTRKRFETIVPNHGILGNNEWVDAFLYLKDNI